MKQEEHKALEYFRIVACPSGQQAEVQTAAIISCISCRIVLSGMGGGGDFICQDCLSLLRGGALDDARQKTNR